MPHNELNSPPPLPRSNRTPFEWSLSALQPLAPEVNSPAILFQAGRSSREREVLVLRIVSITTSMLLVGLLIDGATYLAPQHNEPTPSTSLVFKSPINDEFPASACRIPLADSHHSSADPSMRLTLPVRESNSTFRSAVTTTSVTDAKDVAEMLQFRRNVLNTGLGLLPTDGPDLTPNSIPRAEKC